jgi:hypothetical protein
MGGKERKLVSLECSRQLRVTGSCVTLEAAVKTLGFSLSPLAVENT